MTVFEYLFYPSLNLRGMILSLLFSTAIPLLLSLYYEKRYPLQTGEKLYAVAIAWVFMVVGTLIAKGPIPLPVWSLLAYHFVVDMKYMELPNGVTAGIAVLSVFSRFPDWLEQGFLTSGPVTALVVFLFMMLVAFLGPLGGGDIKMMTALGLYFSVWEIPSLLFYGSLIGTIKGLYLIFVKRRSKSSPFPFGPSLILGALVTICT